MKKVIITGPTGAIGTALVNQMTQNGIRVLAICHRGSERIATLPVSPLLEIIECDLDEIEHSEAIAERGRDADVFFHLAWRGTVGKDRNDAVLQEKNAVNSLEALRTAKRIGCKRFIGIGSQAEYGRYEGMLSPDLPTNPENAYGAFKLKTGNAGRALAEEIGIEFIWVRVLSVYGENDTPNSLISMLIRKLKAREHISCTKGEQLWDYLYSKDAATALYLLGISGIPGKTYVLGGGLAAPLREYIEKVRDAIDPKASIGFGEIPYSDAQVMHLEADISELKKDTGFEVRYTFEEGIADMLA